MTCPPSLLSDNLERAHQMVRVLTTNDVGKGISVTTRHRLCCLGASRNAARILAQPFATPLAEMQSKRNQIDLHSVSQDHFALELQNGGYYLWALEGTTAKDMRPSPSNGRPSSSDWARAAARSRPPYPLASSSGC